MSGRVKNELLRRIMLGEIPPGTRLIELHLAKEFDTSQGPIREALCELEGMDLVTTEPYRGTRVREVTVKDVRDAYLVRASLEELAGRLSAPQLEGNTAPLEKEVKAALHAAERNDLLKYNFHNICFHRMIVEASLNRILIRTWNALAFEVHIQFRLTREKVNLMRAQEPHWPILEALHQGDGLRAGKLLRCHILESAPALD